MLLILYFFERDTNVLIVIPIEEMMQRVREVAKNPLTIAEQQTDSKQFETTLVQNTLIQISNLLSIVFGVAGTEIIGQSILHQGNLNLMAEGKKKCAIYGLCSIRNFIEVTQVLQ